MHTLEDDAKQLEILEQSSLNNEGYKTLKDANKRMKYVLELKEVLGKEGTNPLPQAFLMEMMDINEEIMELQFDFDAAKKAQLTNQVAAFEQSLEQSVASLLELTDISTLSEADLEAVKDFYLKKKYLFRIYENLNKFAPDSDG